MCGESRLKSVHLFIWCSLTSQLLFGRIDGVLEVIDKWLPDLKECLDAKPAISGLGYDLHLRAHTHTHTHHIYQLTYIYPVASHCLSASPTMGITNTYLAIAHPMQALSFLTRCTHCHTHTLHSLPHTVAIIIHGGCKNVNEMLKRVLMMSTYTL